MSDKTWKAVERRVAAFFGTFRNRCSGSSGRLDESASDTVHETVFIEAKHGDPARFFTVEARTLLADGPQKAIKEGKRFVACLHPKKEHGFWIVVRDKDFVAIAKEVMARTET